MTTPIEQHLTDYLGGTSIRNRPENLALLREYPDWQRMAQLLLDQRATRWLSCFRHHSPTFPAMQFR